jgi:hypothetical protein
VSVESTVDIVVVGDESVDSVLRVTPESRRTRVAWSGFVLLLVPRFSIRSLLSIEVGILLLLLVLVMVVVAELPCAIAASDACPKTDMNVGKEAKTG